MRFDVIVIVTSFVWLFVSFWNRNDIPSAVAFVPAIAEDPRQQPTRERPFAVRYDGVEYLIEPEYSYELTGMVVSYRHHDGKSRMHRRSNDHLNMLDVCVVWGDNAATGLLHEFDFWNGIFTCRYQTRDQQAWDRFRDDQLSNNHLLSDDDDIRRRVRDIAIGDQIRVRGYLASYTSDNGSRRGTSTTREDTGNGACETIFIDQFEIVEAATSYWRLSMWTSLALLLGSLIVYFRRPYRPY